jgi:hypothetical protein
LFFFFGFSFLSAAREVDIRQAHEAYLALAETFLAHAQVTRLTLIEVNQCPLAWFTAWMITSPMPGGRSTRSGAGCTKANASPCRKGLLSLRAQYRNEFSLRH